MMDLTRRHFLRGTLGLVGGALLPRIPSYLPVVFLDGTHDDGPGLNALFRGKPVAILNEAALMRPSAHEIIFYRARILTREQIVVPCGVPALTMSDCHVDATELPEGAGSALRFDMPTLILSGGGTKGKAFRRIENPTIGFRAAGSLKDQPIPQVHNLYVEGPAIKAPRRV